MNISLEKVAKKVRTIEKIEKKELLPTYKQLDTLADLYEVPEWVFISKTLPEQYRYTQRPSFRTFIHAKNFQSDEIRKLSIKVEHYRDLFIELKDDLSDSFVPFNDICSDSVKNIKNNATPLQASTIAKEWLKIEESLSFDKLKQKLEEKSIFVFITSKYRGWSHVTQHEEIRGIAFPHEVMPIIVINDSDAKKAQSFTLMHELGHLLRGVASIDSMDNLKANDEDEEKWCNEFAGNILIPIELIKKMPKIEKLSELKQQAKQLYVSPYALSVRLRKVNKITQDLCDNFIHALDKEYKNTKEKQKKSTGGPQRNRLKEVRRQFGNPFVNTVLTAFHREELSLLKTSKILNLKKPEQVIELEA